MVSFLQPGLMLGAAGLVLAGLIALYVLRLRRRPIRISSVMFWLDGGGDREVNVPFARLRTGLLFLLHALLLLCLLLSLGRPVLNAPASGQRILIVIDRSASMAARVATPARDSAPGNVAAEPPPTRLQRAIAAASARAELALDQQSTVAIASFAATARLEATESRSNARITEALSTIFPADEPGLPESLLPILKSLLLAQAQPTGQAATEDAGQALRQPLRILIYSDSANTEPWPQWPAGAAVEILSPDDSASAGAGEANIGIVDFSITRDPADRTAMLAFVRLASSSPAPAEVPISLQITSRGRDPVAPVTELISLRIVADGSSAEGSAVLRLANAAEGLVTATLDQTDSLAADNVAEAYLAERAPLKLLLIAPDATRPPAAASADPVLAAILSELVSEPALPTSSDGSAAATASGTVVTISESQWRQMSFSQAAETEAPDLLIFDRVDAVGLQPAGNGLPALLAATPSIHWAASSPVATYSATPLQSSRRQQIVNWNRSDPLLEFVTPDNVSISMRGVFAPIGEPQRDFVPLLDGQSELLGIATALNSPGPRRLALGFALSESSWPTDVSFVVFMSAAVESLTNQRGRAEAIALKTGRNGTVQLPRAYQKPGSEAVLMRGDRVLLTEALVPGQTTLMVPAQGRTGALTARLSGSDAATFSIPVNLLDEGETRLASSAGNISAGGDGGGSETAMSTQPRDLTRELLYAVLALLILEWLAYSFSGRNRR